MKKFLKGVGAVLFFVGFFLLFSIPLVGPEIMVAGILLVGWADRRKHKQSALVGCLN